MSNRNPSDSQQLDWLRACYHRSNEPPPATPYRLGMFAAATSAKIDDFGAHSARWCRLFEAGFVAQLTILGLTK